MYKTRLEKWKLELSAELGRSVTYEEIAKDTGVAYSTLQKHVGHVFSRPDFATAARICEFFNRASAKRSNRTPLDYFVMTEEPGQVPAFA